jgi:hypothetical protein
MAGFGYLALAHTAIRGHRRNARDARTAAGLKIVAQIENEDARWSQRGEPHPADAAAHRNISVLRAAVGADAALYHGTGSGLPARRAGGARS